MAPTFIYSLQGTESNRYLVLGFVLGTFDMNTDLVLDYGVVDGTTYPVKEIVHSYVFSDNTSARKNLRSITMNNLTTLSGINTFYSCTGLTSVSFPSLITLLGDSTFYDCTGLTSVSFPILTTLSGSNTFYYCTGLTSVTFPNLTTFSGSNTFYGCARLTSVSFPNLTTFSGNSTFSNCTRLTPVSFPNLTTISGSSTFFNCTDLSSVYFPSLIKISGSYTFLYCIRLPSVSFPNLTTFSGNSTFSNCTSLVTCVLGTITSFPALLFNSCVNLHNLYIRSTSSPSLTNANTFNGTSVLNFIFIRSDANWSGFTAKTPQPVSVPSVTVTQSLGSTLLTATATSSLPSGYTIPYYTYQWYKNGLAINGATSATYIAFTNDTYYVRVTDPLLQTTQSTSVIGQQAITYTVLANGTAIITGCGLSGAIKLMYISGSTTNGVLSNIPSSSAYPITQIDAGAFLGQTGITGVAAPFVTTVGASAFSGCTALAYLYIGIASGVPTFGTGCFTGCTALTSNVFKNVYNTEWTADPSPGGTGLNTYRPLTVTVVASEISVPVLTLTPVVQSGGTASKSTPILTTLYNYYVNGVRTQTDIAAPVTQLLSIRKDTYFLTVGNAFETNTAVSTGGSQGVSKFTGGKGKMTVYIGQ